MVCVHYEVKVCADSLLYVSSAAAAMPFYNKQGKFSPLCVDKAVL